MIPLVGFRRLAPALVLALLAAPVADGEAPHHPAASVQSPFAKAMAEAMQRMDHDMMVAASGDPDRDFARMMIPHHQGAIDMARAELQYGRDPVLRRLAQGIIVEQHQEIEVMRRRLDSLSDRNHPDRKETR